MASLGNIGYTEDMSFPISQPALVALGFLPSLVWLGFFLKQDLHPEPRYLLIRTFLMGMIISPLAVLLQWGFVSLGQKISPALFAFDSLSFFLWAALVEEVVKFLAIKFMILNKPDFDEPMDAMVYMITASLGFAAIENVLILLHSSLDGPQGLWQLWALRSLGAVPLHALAGALSGYFLSLAWFYHHHLKKLIALGLILASLFHFTFNILIFSFESNPSGLIYSWFWLAIFGLLVHILFSKIKERSVSALPNFLAAAPAS